jgi:hypothetical protein
VHVFPTQVPPCVNFQIIVMHSCVWIIRALAHWGPHPHIILLYDHLYNLAPKKILLIMQEVMTTNLALSNPGSIGLIFHNLQISPQTSRQSTMTTGTNEVAMWVLHLYIVPFSQLPYSILRDPSVCFPIHLQPWDQDPATYTVTFPRPLSILDP